MAVPQESNPLDTRSAPATSHAGRVCHPELFRVLRGIWRLNAQELVVEVDQETGELMACTYEAEDVDPCSVVTKGVQVRSFEPRSRGH